VAGHHPLAQEAHLSIEWGLKEAKIENMDFLQFLIIFGYMWVAMVAHGDKMSLWG
jgi:hypothetical protein